DDPANPAGTASYYGNLDMAVNFNSSTTTDAISGTAGNFVQFFSTIASPKTGSSVSGSLALSGNLTGTNESFTDGLAGTATGTIDGISVSYTLDGNINGLTGNGVSLYFSGANAVSTGGVGLAVQ
ncbi:MAG: hypothetical protein OXQ30_17845, partial [Boseongicola sp.]|nr:hypothetical protein [Boseongicola sp.]